MQFCGQKYIETYKLKYEPTPSPLEEMIKAFKDTPAGAGESAQPQK
jgi:hypothetical protein